MPGRKKRKGPGEADDESDDYPVWVLSPRLFDLYHAGKKPPAEVQLSAKAAKEVKRLKAWALATSVSGSMSERPFLCPGTGAEVDAV